MWYPLVLGNYSYSVLPLYILDVIEGTPKITQTPKVTHDKNLLKQTEAYYLVPAYMPEIRVTYTKTITQSNLLEV